MFSLIGPSLLCSWTISSASFLLALFDVSVCPMQPLSPSFGTSSSVSTSSVPWQLLCCCLHGRSKISLLSSESLMSSQFWQALASVLPLKKWLTFFGCLISSRQYNTSMNRNITCRSPWRTRSFSSSPRRSLWRPSSSAADSSSGPPSGSPRSSCSCPPHPAWESGTSCGRSPVAPSSSARPPPSSSR